jgi:hypothetical protein
MTKILNWLRTILLKDIEARVTQLEEKHKTLIASLNTPQSHSGLRVCSNCNLLVARFDHKLDGSVICANCKR